MRGVAWVILLTFGVGALGTAAVVVTATWRAVADELLGRNFRSQPPNLRAAVLLFLGVLMPVGLIALLLVGFALRLATIFLS